ncbi:MAG: SPFH domain-containing protein [Chloroflexi bacterium]|nr:SPFH domain-containing protein [Chloroflexota bacterium]
MVERKKARRYGGHGFTTKLKCTLKLSKEVPNETPIKWYSMGNIAVQVPSGDREFQLSPDSAEVVKGAANTVRALVYGRRTFDIALAWGGKHPLDVPPDSLTAHVRALLASAMTDVLGELSREVADVAQLTAMTEQITKALQSKLEPKFSALGLQMKAVNIEAIESV